MAFIEIQNLFKRFKNVVAINRIQLEVKKGEMLTLLGPSGCGKSTLLRAILGTHPPKEGTIVADGKPIQRPSRNVGIVYQHYSLYSFLTARENVAFGLMLDQTSLSFRWLQFP